MAAMGVGLGTGWESVSESVCCGVDSVPVDTDVDVAIEIVIDVMVSGALVRVVCADALYWDSAAGPVVYAVEWPGCANAATNNVGTAAYV